MTRAAAGVPRCAPRGKRGAVATSGFAYHRPTTLREAWRLLAEHPGAALLAGGTDLLVRIRARELQPSAVVSLRSIPELAGAAAERGGGLRLGAATPVADLLRRATVVRRYPLLAQALRVMASPQIRNVATLGGNLCNASPCADTAPPLLAYEARVELRSARGRRELPLEEFFRGPGTTARRASEILTAVRLPAPPPGARVLFHKQRRVHLDLALASVAVLLRLQGTTCRRARLAAGSVGPTPLRLRAVERFLEGRILTEEVAVEAGRLAATAVSPITDLRSTADWRRRIVEVRVRRALVELAGLERAGGAP
ncbi:MAG: xanthine dehydrogenase family protein subunit M [Deltaproteobacteria bacterium]|nr:xanthine dehydrogenase family protein subunit M [Deltaproteobacteria bacterium]